MGNGEIMCQQGIWGKSSSTNGKKTRKPWRREKTDTAIKRQVRMTRCLSFRGVGHNVGHIGRTGFATQSVTFPNHDDIWSTKYHHAIESITNAYLCVISWYRWSVSKGSTVRHRKCCSNVWLNIEAKRNRVRTLYSRCSFLILVLLKVVWVVLN